MKGESKREFARQWAARKVELSRSRHVQLYRFPAFPSCAYVYYDKPEYIEERLHYWGQLDLLFEHHPLLSMLPDADRLKILDEIDSILPRPSGRLLEILEDAYRIGMPRAMSPEEYYNKKVKM